MIKMAVLWAYSFLLRSRILQKIYLYRTIVLQSYDAYEVYKNSVDPMTMALELS